MMATSPRCRSRWGRQQEAGQSGGADPRVRGALEGDAKTITAFLLVPYFGACIHVPPPPTNQVIYVSYPKGAGG